MSENPLCTTVKVTLECMGSAFQVVVWPNKKFAEKRISKTENSFFILFSIRIMSEVITMKFMTKVVLGKRLHW